MTRFTRIIAVDPPGTDHPGAPGVRLVLSRGGDGDPDEIYLAEETVEPGEIYNPDAKRHDTAAMIFLDERILRWINAATGELLAEIRPAIDGIPQHEPTAPGEIVIDHDSEPTIPGVIRRKDGSDE